MHMSGLFLYPSPRTEVTKKMTEGCNYSRESYTREKVPGKNPEY